MKKIAIAVLVLLLTPASAGATLKMTGDARPRHFNWARAAQANVPLPDQRFRIYSDADPMYFPGLREMYLPQPGWGGWTYWDEHVLFLHELGHVFDFTHLSRAERNQFRALVGTPCSWWSKRCKLPPGEMFAEMYAACGLGMTKLEVDAVPSVSYGWTPPLGADATLCLLIRSFK